MNEETLRKQIQEWIKKRCGISDEKKLSWASAQLFKEAVDDVFLRINDTDKIRTQLREYYGIADENSLDESGKVIFERTFALTIKEYQKEQKFLTAGKDARKGNHIIVDPFMFEYDKIGADIVGYNYKEQKGFTKAVIQRVVSFGIEPSTFSGSIYLTEIVISKGAVYIGLYNSSGDYDYEYDVFEDCPALMRITVDSENTVFSDIDGVLYNKAHTHLLRCPQGKTGDFVIPDGVTRIWQHAFDGCCHLTSICIPDSVTQMGIQMFKECINLKDLIFLTRNVEICKIDVIEDIVIHGYYGSTAEKYAALHHLRFKPIFTIFDLNLLLKQIIAMYSNAKDTSYVSQVNESQSENHKQKEQANTFVIDFDNMESLAFTRPTSLEIFGSKYTDITDWRSLYVRLLTMLYERNPIILDQLKNKSIASGKKDFSNELGFHSMIAPKEITKEFYAETNLSATDICKKIRTLLNDYDISYNDVHIYYEKKNNKSISSHSSQGTSLSSHATVNTKEDDEITDIQLNCGISLEVGQHVDIDAPFRSQQFDEENESEQIFSQNKSDCPFNVSISDIPLPLIPDEDSKSAYLEPIESEEDSDYASEKPEPTLAYAKEKPMEQSVGEKSISEHADICGEVKRAEKSVDLVPDKKVETKDTKIDEKSSAASEQQANANLLKNNKIIVHNDEVQEGNRDSVGETIEQNKWIVDVDEVPKPVCQESIESEEDSDYASEIEIPEPAPDKLISEEFKVEEDAIIHKPSGTYIHDMGIEVLSLSCRSYNALRRCGIQTVTELALLTLPDLQKIKNVGKNSSEEIVSCLNAFLLEYIKKENPQKNLTKQKYYGISKSTEEESTEKIMFSAKNKDMDIDNTTLSLRAKNCLCRKGIRFLSQLSTIGAEEIKSIQGIGQKTLQEILDYQGKIQDEISALQDSEKSFSSETLEYLDSFLEEVHEIGIENKYPRSLLLVQLDENCNTKEKCYSRWWNTECVCDNLCVHINRIINSHVMFGISEDQICKQLPSSIGADLLSKLLDELIEKNQIVRNGTLYYPKTYAALDILRKVPKIKERRVEVLEKRMNQHSLNEIAEHYCLTRERIRQVQEKAIQTLRHECEKREILLSEERFKALYETYQLTEEEFIALTGTDRRSYRYLRLAYKSGTIDSSAIEHDETLPEWMHKNWIRYVRKSTSVKYIDLPEENGRRIPKTRNDIENYILSKYCQDGVSYDEFIRLYNDFIYKHQLENENQSNLVLTEDQIPARKNKLSESEFVLWKYGEKLRYYNISAYDYTDLLQTLDLSQYHDTEFSAYKLFRDNPELMKQYDIRDAYELHNLLRKIGVESENETIIFKKMPGIRFGKFDRDQMVKEKLFELAPIYKKDFAKMLSEEYGFAFEQTISWLDVVDEYCRNGIFTVDSEPLSDEHMTLLKSYLTEDFYFFSEVKKIYLELFPNDDINLVSSFNLKRMGFIVNSTYIIQHYDSASDFFEHLLTQDDVRDISQYCKKYGKLGAYSSKLAELKDNYEIIEFLPYQYIHIRKLQEMGIGKENLRKYCNEVYDFVEKGTYFTVEYLQKQGFSSQLDKLGFDAWFYSSLLREDSRFSYIKLRNTVLFCKDSQPISQQTFLCNLMQKYHMIELDEFLEKLYDIYHITLDKTKLKENIKNTEIYYDEIMEKLYQNYQAYYDELEAIEDDWMESEET